MASQEVQGIPLSQFEGPIEQALYRYSEITDGSVLFEYLEQAVKLELTPNKPNTARSIVHVYHEYQKIGSLCIIAFAPHDATGDDKTFKAGDFATNIFPDDPRYFPRSKKAAHAEVHMTIASKNVDSQKDPVMFSGHLSMLGIVEQGSRRRLIELGYVGQESHSFASTMGNRHKVDPRVTLTTGYWGELEHPNNPGERFGDPHALLNQNEGIVQVAGFIAISPELAPAHLRAFKDMRAKEPFIGDF